MQDGEVKHVHPRQLTSNRVGESNQEEIKDTKKTGRSKRYKGNWKKSREEEEKCQKPGAKDA